MQIPVSQAKGQLTELVRRAEAGEDVTLTRHGQPAVRLVPVTRKPSSAEKRALIAQIRTDMANRLKAGPDAAHSQDFLYDEKGMPS